MLLKQNSIGHKSAYFLFVSLFLGLHPVVILFRKKVTHHSQPRF